MYQRVCKGCKTQAEAYAFVSALPPLFADGKITIAKIAEWMYVPGGPYLELKDLTVPMVKVTKQWFRDILEKSVIVTVIQTVADAANELFK